MYCELKEDYDEHLASAKAHGIDPLCEGFNPSSAESAPPELSRWLHLFCAYLQVEQQYADALEGLGRSEPRLVDPPSQKSLQEELHECLNLMLYGNEKGEDQLSHKEL
ncbi:g4755 [Coccomyxa viridis]|uniref:G4755 protein n=1 Tax=Coccomyxa viridis TaxID=1274662 RepID=A0ABP1FTQ2_9CHLO